MGSEGAAVVRSKQRLGKDCPDPRRAFGQFAREDFQRAEVEMAVIELHSRVTRHHEATVRGRSPMCEEILRRIGRC